MQPSRACYACAPLAAVLAAGVACAQPEAVTRPEAARRIVSQFDFEADAREVFETPRYWDLAQDGSRWAGSRPGFPAWNSALFDREQAYSGKQSVRLTTRGGSTSLRVEPGVIPVFPGTDYLVSARVKTGNVAHARAAVTARYLDKSNVVIPGSESRSDVVRSAGDEWVLVTVPLSGAFANAAYIQIDLELLQPEQFEAPTHLKHQVWPEDFAGSVWFDQVAVVQLPRAVISTSSSTNIIRSPERPKVSVMLRDLTGEQITGTFALQDAAGTVVDSMTRILTGGAGVWDWEPKVEQFGWYRASLELRTQRRRVGATYVDLAWLPAEGAASADSTRFAVLVNDLPADQRGVLAGMVKAAGAGAVTVPVWSQGTTAAEIEALCKAMVPLVEQLRSAGTQLTFSLPRIPGPLAAEARLGSEQIFALFETNEKLWGPYVVPLLDKFGQGVQRWQFGAMTPDGDFAPPTREQLGKAHRVLSTLVPGPVIEFPWRADRIAGDYPGMDVELLAVVPPGVADGGVTDLAAAWSGQRIPTTMVLSALSTERHSRIDSCTSLVKQAVLLWGGGETPPTLAVAQPWDWPTLWRGQGPMPHAELAAWSNVSQRLRGRRAAGRLSLRPGVSCLIFAAAPAQPSGSSDRKGCLVLWADSPAGVGSTLDLYLGDGPVEVVDMFGNRRSVEPVAQGAGAGSRTPMAHPLPVTDQPVFIEHVDVDLAVFAASFRLDPAFAASSSSEHQVTMMLSNPWKDRVEGRITVLEPGGLSSESGVRDRSWRITPRTSGFSIGPGETGRVPLLVAFSAVEEAGARDFLVEIELVGTKDYAPIRLRSSLEIGVSDFHVDLSYRVVNGQDVAVEAQLINRGKTPSSYELSGFADGYPRGKAYISDLPAGALATRRFLFPGGAAKLNGQRVVVGVQDVSSQSRVTRSLVVE